MQVRKILAILGFIGFWIVGTFPIAKANGSIRAAAGKINITPTEPVYLAGYGIGRKSEGVHDPIQARCLVLEVNGEKIAFVSCDVIGLFHSDIVKIRAQIKTLPPNRVMISATHTHSGPDTLGQWGPNPAVSGVDKTWLSRTETQIAVLVDETAQKLQPAKLSCGTTKETPPVSKNIRVPRILDREMGVLNVVGLNGKPIATLVNFACHPEILDTHQITADFPAWLTQTVEAKRGGVCLYLNGAQGGMITADFDESTTPKGQNWAAAERIGNALGQCVLDTIPKLEPLTPDTLTVQQRMISVPLENPRFVALVKLKVFPPDLMRASNVETEVNRITLGDLEILTIPGEALPNIGFYLKGKMTGKYKFLLGLTGDELGYILTPEDFGLELYRYEASVSIGEQLEPKMTVALLSLIAETKSKPATKPVRTFLTNR